MHGDPHGVAFRGTDRPGALPHSNGKKVLFLREKQQFPVNGRAQE